MSDDKTQKIKSEPVVKPEKEEVNVEAPEIAKLKEQLAGLEAQAADLENRWKRAVADYQNLVKRTEERRGEVAQFALKMFFDKFLPVLDDIEMAHKHLKDQGLELAMRKMEKTLKEVGLERIETAGKEYDLQTMEAIDSVPGETDNKVVMEHRPGYLMYGAVLRPAQVTVSKKK